MTTKRIGLVLAAIALAIGLSACEGGGTSSSSEDSDGSGLVVTPRGGLGVDLGGGVYIDPSNGQIGFGIPLG